MTRTGTAIGFCIVAGALAGAPRVALAQDDVSEGSGEGELQVHGFVSQGFMLSTSNNYLGPSSRGSFEFFEAGVNVSKELGDDVRVGVQVFAQDLGDVGNYQPVIDWALVDWRVRPWLGVRAGRLKLPLGLYNENWDVDVSRTPVLLPVSVYDPRFRDVLNAVNGGSLYGTAELGGGGSIDWVGYAGTVYVPPHVGDLDVGNVFGAQAIWSTPVPGLRVGGHLLYANWDQHYDVGGMQVTAHMDNWLQMGGSAEYVNGPFTLTAEYRRWTADQTLDPAIAPPSQYHTDGGYVMAQVQAAERLSFSGYYSMNFEDTEHRDDPAQYHKDAALGTRFDLTPSWTVKGEAHYIDGTTGLSGSENPDGEDQHWGLFLVKTSLAF